MQDLTFSECGSSHILPFFLMTRFRVELSSTLNRFLPNVLAEPARFYFWRFLRTAAIPFVATGGAKDALTLVRAQRHAISDEQLSEIQEQRT
jgi:hypothetical protein